MKGIELLVASLCLNCTLEYGSNNTISEDSPILDDSYLPIDNSMPLPNDDTIDDNEIDLNNDRINILDNKLAALKRLRKLREWLDGTHLRIATIEDYPLSYTEQLPNGTRQGKGVAFELVNFLQEKFNFTYEVLVPENNVIGSNLDYENSLLEKINKSVMEALVH